jgi:predicted RNA polymerase sigma factor
MSEPALQPRRWRVAAVAGATRKAEPMVAASKPSRSLAEEGIWLGRLVASLLPGEPEALGLLALMLHAEARRGARRTARREFVPLADQDPAVWDAGLIDEAEALLLRAVSMNGIGRYQLEAAAQSAHANRRVTGRKDWAAIVQIYDALLTIIDSPVVAINRAVACAEADSPAAGLAALAAIANDSRLSDYQPYWAACAELRREQAISPRQKPHINARSAWNPIPRYAAFCSSVAVVCAIPPPAKEARDLPGTLLD